MLKSKTASQRYTPSGTRKVYFARLIGRCAVLAIAVWMFFCNKEAFSIAEGWNFFAEFSVLHLLWAVWMGDMILQLIPVRAHISIGSQKVFAECVGDTTGAADKVMRLGAVVDALIAV